MVLVAETIFDLISLCNLTLFAKQIEFVEFSNESDQKDGIYIGDLDLK